MVEIKPLNLSSDTTTPMMSKKPQAKSKGKLILWFLVIILLGAGSGFGLFRLKQPGGTTGVKYLSRTATDETMKKGATFGVQDEKSFPDLAEGQLVQGGIDGEGSHHLIREGGESQNVYLTSSIIDLDQFVGKKVKVWGQTFQAQKAGWLMDVGRLEIQE
ncbi:MAG: hypothetical protein NTZ93_03040 [Candidatus Beckwithbacteria bacterium]|nr:hypothetical protein [Candidatus Beckwithbacteria bacterium]